MRRPRPLEKTRTPAFRTDAVDIKRRNVQKIRTLLPLAAFIHLYFTRLFQLSQAIRAVESKFLQNFSFLAKHFRKTGKS